MAPPPLRYTLILVFHLCISSSAVKFHKLNFTDPNDATIIFEGGAARSDPGGIIRLTNAHHRNEVSRITYADKIPLWDSATGNLSDFTTHFSFSVAPKKWGKPKQLPCGISFFLAPVGFPVPTNSAGGYMGLYNFTYRVYSPPNKVVHVEFDSFVNPAWDPPFYHVGINNNSIASSAFSSWEIDSDSISGNHTITVEINYTASTHNLTVFWMNANEIHPNPNPNSSILSYVIDLREVLPEWVTVGFTATTNQIQGNQDLLWWDFSSNLEMSDNDNGRKITTLLTALLAVPLVFAIAVTLILIGLSRQRKSKEETIAGVSLLSMNVEFSKGAGPRWIPYNDLVSATNNFTTKLGEGGFGGVYKGILKGGLPVAVKKFSRRSSQGIQEYITEVRVISRLRHRNLVKLVGWCHDKGEFLLVYEFMPNGSLDSHLFENGRKNNENGNVVLQWAERYRVVMGLASALLYLHEEWEQCVVHRDIKAANLMLDSGFNVKLGDFGLARMVDHELGAQTTRLAGTIGYMSPEYIGTGRASKESDVYSFGVVCLEMATGRRVVDYIEEGLEMGLVEWVWELYGNGNHGVAIDNRLLADGFE
ncbi:L-type lectin-domain containing receptor kinase IX.1 [Linum grandiflorum]